MFGLWPRTPLWAQSCPHANSKPLVKEHRSNFPGLSFKEQQKELGKMVSVFYQYSLRFSWIHLNSFSVNHCKSWLQKERVTLSPWKVYSMLLLTNDCSGKPRRRIQKIPSPIPISFLEHSLPVCSWRQRVRVRQMLGPPLRLPRLQSNTVLLCVIIN